MNWRPWAVVGAVLLAMSVSYFVGKKTQATADKLSANHAQIITADSLVRVDSAQVDTVSKRSDILLKHRENLRAKITVSHDSIILHDTVIVNHELAQLIVTDDTLPKTLANEREARAKETADLRATIARRDERIKLLESKGSSRFSKGIQAGIGYCATATGQMPCLYVGYGLQVRLP